MATRKRRILKKDKIARSIHPIVDDFNDTCADPLFCSRKSQEYGFWIPYRCNECGWHFTESRRKHFPDRIQPIDEVKTDDN